MNIAAVLAAIVQALPLVESLVAIVDRDKTSPIPEVAALAAKIIPNVQALVLMFETIRVGTEDEYEEVWAPIRDRWNDAFAKWNAGE